MNFTSSWVYIFSKFTSEALLLESLAICALTAMYAVFWVTKKRKLGSAGTVVPSGLVKAYLSDLIGDAEQLRIQLFGLLSAAGMDPASASFPGGSASPGAGIPGALHPGPSSQKLTEMEAKMVEQAKAMEAILAEKQSIENELKIAKTSGAGNAATGPGNASDLQKLQDKIKVLESKLAEYNVIEDDLANLKRLQQENAQLRAQLAGKAPEPALAAPSSAPTEAPAPIAAPAPALAPPPAAELPTPLPTDDAAFEGLVDQVEKSLQAGASAGESLFSEALNEATPPVIEPTPAVMPAAAETKPPDPVTPTITPTATMEKSDADLVAEFEKILNS